MARAFKRKEGSWAVQATLDEIQQFLSAKYRETRAELRQRRKLGLRHAQLLKRLTYLAVLLIQARNGCRVGEAVEALRKLVESGENAVYVRVEKKYKRIKENGKTVRTEPLNVKRKIVRPQQVSREDLKLMAETVEGLTARKVTWWASVGLGINTHAIRHAFITSAARRGVNPAIIAKMIKWSNLKVLMEYISEEEAEKELEEMEI